MPLGRAPDPSSAPSGWEGPGPPGRAQTPSPGARQRRAARPDRLLLPEPESWNGQEAIVRVWSWDGAGGRPGARCGSPADLGPRPPARPRRVPPGHPVTSTYYCEAAVLLPASQPAVPAWSRAAPWAADAAPAPRLPVRSSQPEASREAGVRPGRLRAAPGLRRPALPAAAQCAAPAAVGQPSSCPPPPWASAGAGTCWGLVFTFVTYVRVFVIIESP